MNVKDSKIFIVDDIKAEIKILTRLLESDYQVSSAQNGKEALESIRSSLPDLILLDILMPGMNGYDVIQELKEDTHTRHIPVIFITTKSDAEDETRGFELGAVDYVTKPFCLPIVQARVKSHLVLKKQRDLLEKMATSDALTGIFNRRGFDRFLDHEWRRSIRSASPLSLLFIDIDLFKEFNDNYGHSAGDDCLKQVAQALAQSVRRSTDYVARYGGEEFVALLADTHCPGSLTIASTMQKMIQALSIPHAFSSVDSRITISIGSATMVPTRGSSPTLLIDAADRALYRAKKEGRNRIVTHESA